MVACAHIRTSLYIILYLNILVHYISDTLLYQSSNKAVWQKSSFPKSRWATERIPVQNRTVAARFCAIYLYASTVAALWQHCGNMAEIYSGTVAVRLLELQQKSITALWQTRPERIIRLTALWQYGLEHLCHKSRACIALMQFYCHDDIKLQSRVCHKIHFAIFPLSHRENSRLKLA